MEPTPHPAASASAGTATTPTWVRAVVGVGSTLYVASAVAAVAAIAVAPLALVLLAALGGVVAALHERRPFRPLHRPATAVVVWLLALHLVSAIADLAAVALSPLFMLAVATAVAVAVARSRPHLSLTFGRR